MFRYATTIFLSAFLLFQVQPLIGKYILPWFGGTPAVWTTCMLFFQATLLAGYSYAHFITSKVSPRGQMITHLALLVASLIFLPIAPSETWKPQGDELPIGRILALLTASIGLPYFMLSTTGPLLQESFRRETGKPPYRLYALSNVGSLLALLTYPFVFEPELTLQTQIWGWSIAYCVFAAFCGWCALAFIKPAHHPEFVDTTTAAPVKNAYIAPPTPRDLVLWLALAACGSAVLLATTNLLCQEICSVPFLWILPLALYLTTFIICFDHERWYNRSVFIVLLAVSILGAMWGLSEGTGLELWKQVAIFGGNMWVCCMVCHGELTKSKPAPQYATLFYLMVSAGGVIGGLLVAVVAPLLLNDYHEYRISLVATIILAFTASVHESPTKAKGSRLTSWIVGGITMVGLGVVVAWFVSAAWSKDDPNNRLIESTRNFYGVLHIKHEDDPEDERGPTTELVHGRIQHGFQFENPQRRNWATTYYGPPSGIGMAIEHHPQRAKGPMRIGVIGLGCGTLATYGRKGDYIRFYEINPTVLRISKNYFTFRDESLADIEIILGDARIKMDREIQAGNLQQFDVLAVDAFSSDAIPMHLLTLECAKLFQQHLKPDGIMCLHISNRFLDLHPVVKGLAKELGLDIVLIESDKDYELGLNHSTWALLTKNQEFLALEAIKNAAMVPSDSDLPPILWTDDYASLWQTLSKEQKEFSFSDE